MYKRQKGEKRSRKVSQKIFHVQPWQPWLSQPPYLPTSSYATASVEWLQFILVGLSSILHTAFTEFSYQSHVGYYMVATYTDILFTLQVYWAITWHPQPLLHQNSGKKQQLFTPSEPSSFLYRPSQCAVNICNCGYHKSTTTPSLCWCFLTPYMWCSSSAMWSQHPEGSPDL